MSERDNPGRKQERLARLVTDVRDKLPWDADGAAADAHERGWRRLQASRAAARSHGWRSAGRWAWLLLPAAAAGAFVLRGRDAGQADRGLDVAYEVRGAGVLAGGVLAHDAQGPAVLAFAGGAEAEIEPGSRARLLRPGAAAGGSHAAGRAAADVVLALDEGRLAVRLPDGQPLRWQIAAADVTVTAGAARAGGVEFEARVQARRLDLIVRRGAATMQAPWRPQALALGAGQRLELDLDRHTQRTTSAPTLTRPNPASEAETRAAALAGDPAACPARFVEPDQLTALGPGDTSHWLQPWRAWHETIPATRLLDAPGVTLGARVIDERAVKLLADAGIRHATVEMAWDHVDEHDQSRFELRFGEPRREHLRRLARAGVRPTMLLNAYGGPPWRERPIAVTRDAAAGATTIWLDPAHAEEIVPGRTRFGRGGPADTLIVELGTDGRARLSRPLPSELPAGSYKVQTFRYAPFRRPTLASGEPDPVFQETLLGWTRFVRTNLAFAAEAVGGTTGDAGFDVEVWNQAGSARDLWDVERFYDPLPPELGPGGIEVAMREMLGAVLRVVREPGTGYPGVRVANGFANRRWSESALTQLPGVDALGRHVVLRTLSFPLDAGLDPRRALDRRGLPDGAREQGAGAWKSGFVPTYEAAFPERPLVALGEEPLFRDLAPLRTVDATGVPHQRPPGAGLGAPGVGPPDVWIDSLNLGMGRRRASLGLDAAETGHARAKLLLRALAAYTGKGAGRVMLFQHDSQEALIDPAAPAGGVALASLARFLAPFQTRSTITRPRDVTLDQLLSCPTHVEFAGDGTPAHPPLRPGDVLAFLPFQTSDDRVVVAAYVMTRDPLRRLAGSRRFDLPPVGFRLRVGGVPEGATVTMVDPLRGTPAGPVTVLARERASLTLEVALTDSPRLLILDGTGPRGR
jgi:hypothetical protein